MVTTAPLRSVALLFVLLFALVATAEKPTWFAPPKINFDAMHPAGETADCTVWNATFLSAYSSPVVVNNAVKLRIYLPTDASGPVPVVVLLHYWGAPNTLVEDEIAGHLARRGIASVAMPLPYHLSRTPAGKRSGELAVVPDIQSLNATMHQAVWDIQRTVDFIESRSEFDSKQIGIGGTSLGAIVSATAFAVDPRFKTAAFLLGGADLAGLVFHSSKVLPVKNEFQRKGIREDQLRAALVENEPTTYLDKSDKRPSLLVTARFDNVVPAKSSDALYQALGNCEQTMLDTGHFGGFLIQSKLAQTVARYFDSQLKGVKYAPPSSLFAPTVRLGLSLDQFRGFQLALGLDIWRANRDRDGFAAILLAPKGFSIFLGKDIGNGLSVGATFMPRQASLGAFWSVVF